LTQLAELGSARCYTFYFVAARHLQTGQNIVSIQLSTQHNWTSKNIAHKEQRPISRTYLCKFSVIKTGSVI